MIHVPEIGDINGLQKSGFDLPPFLDPPVQVTGIQLDLGRSLRSFNDRPISQSVRR